MRTKKILQMGQDLLKKYQDEQDMKLKNMRDHVKHAFFSTDFSEQKSQKSLENSLPPSQSDGKLHTYSDLMSRLQTPHIK